jgi:hypothetical protein
MQVVHSRLNIIIVQVGMTQRVNEPIEAFSANKKHKSFFPIAKPTDKKRLFDSNDNLFQP